MDGGLVRVTYRISATRQTLKERRKNFNKPGGRITEPTLKNHSKNDPLIKCIEIENRSGKGGDFMDGKRLITKGTLFISFPSFLFLIVNEIGNRRNYVREAKETILF